MSCCGAHHAAAGPRSPKSTVTTSPCPFVAGLAGLGGGRLGGGLGGLVGDLALADPVLGLAVGEDLAEVAADRLGAHPRLVAVAQPLLGLRREDEQVALALAADRLHLPGVRADRQHDRLERGVQVGADPGGDGGALARVGVERLQRRRTSRGPSRRGPRRRRRRRGRPPRPGGSRSAGRRGTPAGCRRGRTRPGSIWNCWRQRPGTTAFSRWITDCAPMYAATCAPAYGCAVVRDLGHRAEADRAGRERPAEQGGRLGVGARRRVRVGVRVVGHESP